jgi:hypothetical protein
VLRRRNYAPLNETSRLTEQDPRLPLFELCRDLVLLLLDLEFMLSEESDLADSPETTVSICQLDCQEGTYKFVPPKSKARKVLPSQL